MASHGDVCRNPETRGFFCPQGCQHADSAPYCTMVVCDTVLPCRVPDERGTENNNEVKNIAKDCHSACGGKSGCCLDFCGPAGACCKKDSDIDVEACGFGQFGEGFHGCVRAASPS
eukprot:CAMPEP_0171730208 /NCGR_PEP_ID=MMETSP0991-20121206/28140_1 /TAXON_ID=483369 /ORGANISM="non described non described, Strain CCMP2098" /LENGTH=115 /DNA_ID=CAMNT_0012324869 /DNA_START=166 /DNA_END=513 /DNA_ORIENTATION=+